MQYPLKPAKTGMATTTKIGIGAGAGSAVLIIGVLLWLFMRKHRAHKRDKAALESVTASSTVGDVKEWRKSVPGSPPGTQSRFYEGLEIAPKMPNVSVVPAPAYAGDWRPGQQVVSTAMPHPYARHSVPNSISSGGLSDADSQTAMLDNRYSSVHSPHSPGVGSDGGYSNGNRSELQSGEYGFQYRQELPGVPEEQHAAWANAHAHDQGQYQEPTQVQSYNPQPGIGDRTRFYEAPAGAPGIAK